jgi:hypothetical protein
LLIVVRLHGRKGVRLELDSVHSDFHRSCERRIAARSCVEKMMRPALQFLPQIGEKPAVNDVRVVLEIEGDVLFVPRQQNHLLVERMRVTGCVEDILVPFRHVRDDEICFRDQVLSPLQNGLWGKLHIEAFGVRASGFASRFDCEFPEIVERCAGRNDSECEWRRAGHSLLFSGLAGMMFTPNAKS